MAHASRILLAPGEPLIIMFGTKDSFMLTDNTSLSMTRTANNRSSTKNITYWCKISFETVFPSRNDKWQGKVIYHFSVKS